MKASKYIFFVPLVFLTLFYSSCKKTETQTISGNKPPVDTTIDNVLRDNYIQKVYLDVIGRAPTELESIGAQTILNKNNCSVANRQELLTHLFATTDFRDHIYSIDNAGLLNSLSSDAIGYYITYYNNLVKDTAQPLSHNAYVLGLQRLYTLKSAYRNFLNDSIDLVEVQKRMTFNPIYDALIGSEYFWMTASFPYFLKRKPTTNEITNCYQFVNGEQARLFLQSGISKADMINIFFNADEYFEGQVRTIYLRYLYRDPTTTELQNVAPQYHKDHDLVKLLKIIFLSNEYLGKK